jgi:hypothetical protein
MGESRKRSTLAKGESCGGPREGKGGGHRKREEREANFWQGETRAFWGIGEGREGSEWLCCVLVRPRDRPPVKTSTFRLAATDRAGRRCSNFVSAVPSHGDSSASEPMLHVGLEKVCQGDEIYDISRMALVTAVMKPGARPGRSAWQPEEG